MNTQDEHIVQSTILTFNFAEPDAKLSMLIAVTQRSQARYVEHMRMQLQTRQVWWQHIIKSSDLCVTAARRGWIIQTGEHVHIRGAASHVKSF